jgi:site-specific DNA-methyltransferase (adenine-specific)
MEVFMNDSNMKIHMLSVDDLVPYERNPRKNDKAVEAVANSIKEFGFKIPIIVDSSMVVVAGHTRLKAAKFLGLKTVPVIIADDLSEQQIKAFRLADNKVAEIAEWDEDLLNLELSELADFDMFLFGFGHDEEETETEVKEDDYEIELPDEPITKPGDIWKLGRHRLMCGDSTDKATVELLMDGNKADMVFTDPPYGYNYQSNMREKTNKFKVIENDDKILDFFPCIKSVCDGFVYICTTWKTADKWIELFKQYYNLTNVIIWDKGGGGIGDLFHTFSTDYEMILVCNNGREIKGKRYGSVWNFTEQEISKMKKEELLNIVLEQKKFYSIWKEKKDNPNEYVHPTQKPVSLSARAIRSSTDIENNVLDLFGGSGSTIIACEQLNRNCYAMELDPKYCDVIVKRWESLTGKKAVLERKA